MKTVLKSLPFALALLIPFAGIRLAQRPEGFHLWILPLTLFGIVPFLDVVLGRARGTLEPEPGTSGRDWRYDLWLWAWIPLQLAAQVLAVVNIGGGVGGAAGVGVGGGAAGALSWSAFLAAAVSIGLVGGVGINVAHELVHRRGKLERALAEVLMTSTTYTHFCVEHVLGHHKHVSTPQDPASSRKGESFYAYLPRTLIGSVRSAWRIEGKRIGALPASSSSSSWVGRLLRASRLGDRRVRYPLVLAVVYAAIFVVAGVWGVVFFALQSAVAMTLLEIINYLEHYGLARRELSPGKYERCLPWHSWNASERLTNWFLFHLQRHADHHHVASRPYFALRHVDESPQLPTGYAGMVVLALFPPLWRRVMDPRVDAWTAHQRALESESETEAARQPPADPATSPLLS